MDIENLSKIIKGIKMVSDAEQVRRDTFNLTKLKNVILLLRDRMPSEQIIILINKYYLEDINSYYKTNFKCEKAEECFKIIDNVMEYINNKFEDSIKEELIKELAKEIEKHKNA